MFKFFLKKNFCDGWDNLFFLLISNLIVIALFATLGVCLAMAAKVSVIALLGVLILVFGLLMMLFFAWGAPARKIADFNTPSFLLLVRSLKESWKTGFVFGVLLAVALFIIVLAIRYYLALALTGNSLGIFCVIFVCMFAFVSAMSLQWFVPLYFLQEDNTFLKCLKKSYIIFFDNAGFSFIVFIHNVIILVLSLFPLFFLVLGINGITLSCMNALRLRLYKYDWLDEHPDYMNNRDKRADVPWEELLAADKEALGERKMTSFLFPWK